MRPRVVYGAAECSVADALGVQRAARAAREAPRRGRDDAAADQQVAAHARLCVLLSHPTQLECSPARTERRAHVPLARAPRRPHLVVLWRLAADPSPFLTSLPVSCFCAMLLSLSSLPPFAIVQKNECITGSRRPSASLQQGPPSAPRSRPYSVQPETLGPKNASPRSVRALQRERPTALRGASSSPFPTRQSREARAARGTLFPASPILISLTWTVKVPQAKEDADALDRNAHCTSCQTHQRTNARRRSAASIARWSASIALASLSASASNVGGRGETERRSESCVSAGLSTGGTRRGRGRTGEGKRTLLRLVSVRFLSLSTLSTPSVVCRANSSRRVVYSSRCCDRRQASDGGRLRARHSTERGEARPRRRTRLRSSTTVSRFLLALAPSVSLTSPTTPLNALTSLSVCSTCLGRHPCCSASSARASASPSASHSLPWFRRRCDTRSDATVILVQLSTRSGSRCRSEDRRASMSAGSEPSSSGVSVRVDDSSSSERCAVLR